MDVLENLANNYQSYNKSREKMTEFYKQENVKQALLAMIEMPKYLRAVVEHYQTLILVVEIKNYNNRFGTFSDLFMLGFFIWTLIFICCIIKPV